MKFGLILAAATALAFGTMPAEARIKRSQSAKVAFKLEHPCPSTGARKGPCKGYVIDHVKALACGGCRCPKQYAVANGCGGQGQRQVGAKGLLTAAS